jgi:hypothetical protein
MAWGLLVHGQLEVRVSEDLESERAARVEDRREPTTLPRLVRVRVRVRVGVGLSYPKLG